MSAVATHELAGLPTDARPDPKFFDLGHQGDFDRTQIAARLRMTPIERLRHHESWRLFVKDCLQRAELRRKNHRCTGCGQLRICCRRWAERGAPHTRSDTADAARVGPTELSQNGSSSRLLSLRQVSNRDCSADFVGLEA